jgi:UDP-N-acetylglucosamine diphosphorylase/glucosamine-1-phosphate N-acetyltransferase
MYIVKAVILAAGEGRRCRPLTQTRSKVMLPVGNKPFMEHVILALAANDVRELVIVVGYQKEKVMDHFEDGLHYDVDITYVTQDEQLGTAHALDKTKSNIDDTFLVLNGDNLVDAQAISDILSAEGENVILTTLREHSGDYGVLTVERQKVTKIIEKPGRPCAGILNTGVYKFSPKIFDELSKTPISERGSYELTQTIERMIEEGFQIRAKMTQGVWTDAIFAWNLLDANSLALGTTGSVVLGEIEEGARSRGPVNLGEGSIVRSGSYIVGPVSIGKNCDIGPNATILPATSIGNSVRIGSHSEIRNSIIMRGTRIGTGSVIADSVLGASSSFGDQLIIESGSSVVEIEEEFHRAEFGAIVADDVIAGSRVFMHPNTIVGTDSRIRSGAMLQGWIERGSKVM